MLKGYHSACAGMWVLMWLLIIVRLCLLPIYSSSNLRLGFCSISVANILSDECTSHCRSRVADEYPLSRTHPLNLQTSLYVGCWWHKECLQNDALPFLWGTCRGRTAPHAPYKACHGRRSLVCHAHLTLYAYPVLGCVPAATFVGSRRWYAAMFIRYRPSNARFSLSAWVSM